MFDRPKPSLHSPVSRRTPRTLPSSLPARPHPACPTAPPRTPPPPCSSPISSSSSSSSSKPSLPSAFLRSLLRCSSFPLSDASLSRAFSSRDAFLPRPLFAPLSVCLSVCFSARSPTLRRSRGVSKDHTTKQVAQRSPPLSKSLLPPLFEIETPI